MKGSEKRFMIRPEFNGREPNLKPAAMAFVRLVKSAVGEDGRFLDADLEAEFQEWKRRLPVKEAG